MEIFSEDRFTPLSTHPRSNLFKAFDEQSAELEVCEFIQKTVQILKPRYAVETGSYKGVLSSYVCEAIAANGFGELDTVEIDEALYHITSDRLRKYPFAKAFMQSSLDFTPRRHIDMLIVDSLFDLRMKEIIRYSPFMTEDTVIFCHDTSPLAHPVMRSILGEAKREMIVEEVYFYDTPRGLSQLRLWGKALKFFCLNMDKATERRQSCKNEFAKAGIDVSFVKAFDTRHNGIRHVREDYQVGHLGCCLSHINIIEETGRYDHTGIIFEDDIVLAEDFKSKLDAVLASLPDDWEIAYIGWWPHFWDYSRLQTTEINTDWLQITKGGIWGNYSYAVNGKKGADKLLSILQPIEEHCDNVIHAAILNGEVKGYYLKNTIACFSENFTSQTNNA